MSSDGIRAFFEACAHNTKMAKPDKAHKTKETWKSDSYDGAFLFLLLHKRVVGTPDDFSASELQDNTALGFDKYNTQTFKRNTQTIANRVKKFEQKGTGLTKHFKELLAQVLKDKPDLFPENEEDEFDEDYKDEKEEEDLSHVSEDEESISDHLQDPQLNKKGNKRQEQPPVDKVNILPTSRRSQKKDSPCSTKKTTKPETTKPETTTMNESDPFSYLETSADGRLIGVIKLAAGWDGTFVIGDDRKSVMMKTKVPRSFSNSQTILQRHGLDVDNIHVIEKGC